MTDRVYHLAARARPGAPRLDERPIAPRLWAGLRGALPPPLIAVVMPNHVHVVVELLDPRLARARLARTLGHVTRLVGSRRTMWEPITIGKPIAGVDKRDRPATRRLVE